MVEVEPVEAIAGEVHVDNHFLDAVEEESGGTENGIQNPLVGEVGQLRAGEVGGLRDSE